MAIFGICRRSSRAWKALVVGWLATGCVPDPPARWVEGGAPLVIPNAEWQLRGGDTIRIQADGNVLEDGEVVFFVDRAGRVTDEDYEPVALLNPDGILLGPDDVLLGRVGVHNASPPWDRVAWLHVRNDGHVVLFDFDGEPHHGGTWSGCEGPSVRTCTLVTHLLALRAAERYRQRAYQMGLWWW